MGWTEFGKKAAEVDEGGGTAVGRLPKIHGRVGQLRQWGAEEARGRAEAEAAKQAERARAACRAEQGRLSKLVGREPAC